MPRVLIAGCGYVGAATADLFQMRGWAVEGWTHGSELPEKSFVVRQVDIAERRPVERAAGEFDLVVHCASSGGGGPESYRRVYLAGARNLLEVLRPGRLIFTSSTSVYAQRDGSWVNEESAAEPRHETGVILRETEEVVRQHGGIVARLAGIYGPGRSAFLRKFLAGEARIDGDGSRFLNHAQRDDIAAALVFLATNTAAESMYNVCDDQPISQRAAYEWLAHKLHRPCPEKAEQVGLRKRGASNKRVSNRKLRELGWEPRFPNLMRGLEDSVLPFWPNEG